MLTSGKKSSPNILNKMRFFRTSNIKLTLRTFSPAFEGIFKERSTILLARRGQYSAITIRVLALRILFLLQSWNVLKMDLSQFGERLVKSKVMPR